MISKIETVSRSMSLKQLDDHSLIIGVLTKWG
jgi:hypothetical protein